MKGTDQIARIECDRFDCDAEIIIDARHAKNFDGRDWYCARHEDDR